MESAHDKDFTPNEEALAVSLELSGKSWKIGLHDGKRDKPAIHTVDDESPASRLAHAVAVIEEVKRKWGLPEHIRVVVSYEAGQDAFWISRALSRIGYTALVVDPASIPVERHARRAKTDRLDVIKLVNSLRAWLRGERDRMHVITVPAPEAEAQRQLLRAVGCWDGVTGDFAGRLARGEIKCYDDTALPPQLPERFTRECERLALAETQLEALEKTLERQLPAAVGERIANLKRLRGVGEVGAMRLVLELFWRDFDNRRQIGACVGLVPQPYDSGESRVDQGISKQGNRRVRALLIEMSWFWLRYQPDSAISKWFAYRTQGSATNKRCKRIAIVAVARRLVIALWRYLENGVVPDGAVMKAA